MKELLTITQLDKLVSQIKGTEKISDYEPVTLLPIKKTNSQYKKRLKGNIESFVQNFNTRDWEAFNGLLSDAVDVNWNGKKSIGRQAVRDGLNTYATLLPDLTFHLDRNVVEGDRGALAYTLIGNHMSNKNADGTSAAKRIEAKEGIHFQFDAAGKISAVVAVSNSDEVKSQLQ